VSDVVDSPIHPTIPRSHAEYQERIVDQLKCQNGTLADSNARLTTENKRLTRMAMLMAKALGRGLRFTWKISPEAESLGALCGLEPGDIEESIMRELETAIAEHDAAEAVAAASRKDAAARRLARSREIWKADQEHIAWEDNRNAIVQKHEPSPPPPRRGLEELGRSPAWVAEMRKLRALREANGIREHEPFTPENLSDFPILWPAAKPTRTFTPEPWTPELD
jgi:hypothetical protein